MGARRGEAPSASLFGWVDPGAVEPAPWAPTGPDPWAEPDELGTIPAFPAGPVVPDDARHAPARPVDPGERCDWPMPCGVEGCDGEPCEDHDPGICGRAAVVIYRSRPTPTARYTADYPRCARHDTAAARRRADADGWKRRTIGGGE